MSHIASPSPFLWMDEWMHECNYVFLPYYGPDFYNFKPTFWWSPLKPDHSQFTLGNLVRFLPLASKKLNVEPYYFIHRPWTRSQHARTSPIKVGLPFWPGMKQPFLFQRRTMASDLEVLTFAQAVSHSVRETRWWSQKGHVVCKQQRWAPQIIRSFKDEDYHSSGATAGVHTMLQSLANRESPKTCTAWGYTDVEFFNGNHRHYILFSKSCISQRIQPL